VLFSRWVHGSNPMAKNNEYHFVSGGAAGVNFWKLEGSTLSKKQGRFSKKYKAAPLLCAANVQGKESKWKVVMGTAGGDLFIYDEREACDAVEGAHKGPVLCVAEGGPDCLFLVSGGRDKVVKVWNQALQPISVFDLTAFSCVDASVGSLDVRPDDASTPGALALLVGTYGGEIIEVLSDETEARNAAGGAGSGGGSGKKSSGDASAVRGGVAADLRNLDLSQASASVLLHSHYRGELWGLAPHPTDPDLVATVGDDSTLRIWSIRRNSMLTSVPLHWPARSVAWHPLGLALAVGFFESVKGGYKSGAAKGGKAKAKPAGGKKTGSKMGGPKPAAKRGAAEAEDDDDGGGDGDDDAAAGGGAGTEHKGAIHLYSFAYQPATAHVDIKKRADGCTSLAWINDLKFSPDGRMLAAGSHDKRLYAYDIPEISSGDVSHDASWESWSTCLDRCKYEFNKHSSAVLHVDFSLDGQYFQSNCQASELLFGAAATGKQETSASKLADYNGQLEDDPELEGRVWATQTCKLGWAVQGIWPPGSDTTDINSVDRSADGKLLATADDFGHVKLFRFPCPLDASKFGVFDGHSSHVTNVRWSLGGGGGDSSGSSSNSSSGYLMSVGGNDKCLFVWSRREE
jgi:WD40 repeat protein